jgi:hypothetical protein
MLQGYLQRSETAGQVTLYSIIERENIVQENINGLLYII